MLATDLSLDVTVRMVLLPSAKCETKSEQINRVSDLKWYGDTNDDSGGVWGETVIGCFKIIVPAAGIW